jgi:4-amino-4-deoxychorismate lyase
VTLLAVAVGGRGVVDPDEAVLHADDAALLRGQAAFETVRVYGGRPFRLGEHLERLASSAERIGLASVKRDELEELAEAALAASATEDCVLRLYWTGGREGSNQPTALVLVSPLPERHDELRARGVRLITLRLGIDPDERASSPWLLGGVKSTSYAVNMAAEAEARRRGADDALFLARDTTVLEGPVTNVWWWSDATLFTPSLELGILAGVTRSQILDSAAALGYQVEQGRYPLQRLAAAGEVFTSASVREIMPVVELDGVPIGGGRPGPVAAALQRALREAAYGARQAAG